MAECIRVLHVIREVTHGGASLGLLNMCRDGPEGVVHEILSLIPPKPEPVAAFMAAGVPVIFGSVDAAIARSDLIQLEWWNSPEMVRFLLSELPPCRLLLHSRAHFDAPCMCPSETLLRRVDAVTVSTPSAASNPVFRKLAETCGLPPAPCIHSGAVLQPAAPGGRQETGRIGYLGTIEGIKMHRRTLPMIARMLRQLPEASFVFAGEGQLDEYAAEAQALGIADRVCFQGFVGDPQAFLAGIDLLFYPLNPYTYATSEKAVQEAMMAGVPVAAFPHGGLRDLLTAECAMLAADEDMLVEGTVALMRSPDRRRHIAAAAQARMAAWPVSRDWRASAGRVWHALQEMPKRPRPLLATEDKAALFALSHAPDACPVPTGRAAEDHAAVASFVMENYSSHARGRAVSPVGGTYHGNEIETG